MSASYKVFRLTQPQVSERGSQAEYARKYAQTIYSNVVNSVVGTAEAMRRHEREMRTVAAHSEMRIKNVVMQTESRLVVNWSTTLVIGKLLSFVISCCKVKARYVHP